MQKKTSILFSSAITLIILHSYTAYISAVLIIPIVFCVSVICRFCDQCYRKGARIHYMLAIMITLVSAYWLIAFGNYDVTFFEWLYIDLSYQDYFMYFLAMFISCCFIVTSIVFYFTIAVFRPLFLFVFLLIPFGLNYTRYISVPAVYTVSAIGLYLTLVIIMSNPEFRHSVMRIKKRTLFAFLAAVCLVASLSFLVDLPENTRQAAEGGDSVNDAITDRNLTRLLGSSPYSGRAEFDRSNEEILFLLEAEHPLFITRQVFFEYDGERFISDLSNDLQWGPFAWERAAEALNYGRLFELALEADDAGGLREPLKHRDIIENLMHIEQTKTARIILAGGRSASRIMTQPRAYGVSGLPDGMRAVRNRLGEIFISADERVTAPYTVTYYHDFFRENQEIQMLARQNEDSLRNILDDLLRYATNNHAGDFENLYTVWGFIDELDAADAIKGYSDSAQLPRTKALAMEITAGIDNDYGMAIALEEYFYESGYRYDTDNSFIDVNSDIEHFIFASKTGTCGHYATAMTLMARTLGLNARYVEGFMSAEVNEAGQYVVRAKHSHAFVQVHIPYYGWVTFDPTVPSEQQEQADEQESFFAVLISNSFMIFSVFSILILLGLGVYFIYSRVIKELLFRFKVSRATGRDGVLLIYYQVLELARKRIGLDNVPSMELEIAMRSKYGLDIEPITTCFCRAFYGEEDITGAEKNEAFLAYRQLYKRMRRKPGSNYPLL